jgi:hypothetical protein
MSDDPQQSPLSDDQIRTHLSDTGRMAIFWSIDDVKSVRPDLTDDQCMKVLDRCEYKHDAEIGINWIVIETHADFMFPIAQGQVTP